MASIRRTLSPVPKPGSRLNGEAASVASPLSRSSAASQGHLPAFGSQYSSYSSLEYAFYKIHTVVLGFFSLRASRSLERPKSKGQGWKRALLHCSICFMIGAFIGLTPFVSMNFSGNLMSKHQTLFFEMVPSMVKYQPSSLFKTRNREVMVEDNLKNESLPDGVADERVLADLVSKDLVIETRKLLIVVTPTHARPFQAYYLNRLAQTLKLVKPPLLWIVVEMAAQSTETADILRRTGVMYRHLVCDKNVTGVNDRSIHQRNVAMAHVETHRLDGIVYFADDDSMYSVDLFEQLRQIRRFGVLKVAKISVGQRVFVPSGPVCNNATVVGWKTNNLRRRFHAEMSGFAFNSTILWDPKRWRCLVLEPIRQLDTLEEFQASAFIEQIVEDESQMEGLFQDCSDIMVWQFPLESPSLRYPQQWSLSKNLDTNIPLA